MPSPPKAPPAAEAPKPDFNYDVTTGFDYDVTEQQRAQQHEERQFLPPPPETSHHYDVT